MRPPLPVAIGLGLLMTANPTHALSDSQPLQPSAARSIAITEAGAPAVVRTGLLQSTLILLPAEEKVANVFAGDTVDWVFDAGHLPSRFISVKPKLANSSTDVHIVTDHGNEYTLELREVSGEEDVHFDSKVFLVPKDQTAKDRIVDLPVFVPVSELDKVKQEAFVAQAAQSAALKAEQAEEESYRSRYPGTLHFDYTWNRSKGRELGLEQVWRDDRFTYLRGQFEETPALYEVKDKKPSLINFDFSNGLFTVPKQLNSGYLAIGRQKVEFHRTQEGR